jgi:hypothetical protein
MKRAHAKALIGCIIFVVGLLAILYAASPIRNDLRRGDFERQLSPAVLSKVATKDVDATERYISGTANGKVFLSNLRKPFEVLEIDSMLSQSTIRYIQLIGVDSFRAPHQFRTKIDPPYFYLTNGTMALFRRGLITTLSAEPFIPDTPLSYFETMAPIGNRSLILRSYSKKQKQLELAKRTTYPRPDFAFKYGILEKQVDGLLCVAGDLHYCKALSKVVYLYTYRNEYLVMDTTLNVSHKCKTIDDITKAQLTVTHVESKNTNMANGESSVSNVRSVIDGDQLFVQSNVMSKAEIQSRFLESSAIDVYNIATGTYAYSFYIPNHGKELLRDFAVRRGYLFALYNTKLVEYKLNPHIIKQNNLETHAKLF